MAGQRGPAGRDALRRSLEETVRELTAARAGFDQTADPDLLEYYLYEIHALRARHTYLLRRLKAQDDLRREPERPG